MECGNIRVSYTDRFTVFVIVKHMKQGNQRTDSIQFATFI